MLQCVVVGIRGDMEPINTTSVVRHSAQPVDSLPHASGGGEFPEILDRVRRGLSAEADIVRSIEGFEQTVRAGKPISFHQLIMWQVQASRFGVQVELVSKAVEGGLSGLRRLQQSQN